MIVVLRINARAAVARVC